MSLIIALGSNLGNSRENLSTAKWILSSHFELVAESSVYTSEAVDYEDQPDFLNQVLEFKIPDLPAGEILRRLLKIEDVMGRIRTIDKGPRVIDIDLIFLGNQVVKSEFVQVPHPRWMERSFVLLPLRELPFYKNIEKKYTIPTRLPNRAHAIN